MRKSWMPGTRPGMTGVKKWIADFVAGARRNETPACAEMSGTEGPLLGKRQVRGLHDFTRGPDIGVDHGAEVFRRAAAGIDRHRLEPAVHVRVGDGAAQRILELFEDRRGRPGGREETAPQ